MGGEVGRRVRELLRKVCKRNNVEILKRHVSRDLHRFLSYVALVRMALAEYIFQEVALFERFPVIDMCPGDAELQNLALLVDQQVQLEAVEPSHGGLPRSGRPLEDPVPFILLLLHTLILVESAKEIPVHLPSAVVFGNKVIGKRHLPISSVNRL